VVVLRVSNIMTAQVVQLHIDALRRNNIIVVGMISSMSIQVMVMVMLLNLVLGNELTVPIEMRRPTECGYGYGVWIMVMDMGRMRALRLHRSHTISSIARIACCTLPAVAVKAVKGGE